LYHAARGNSLLDGLGYAFHKQFFGFHPILIFFLPIFYGNLHGSECPVTRNVIYMQIKEMQSFMKNTKRAFKNIFMFTAKSVQIKPNASFEPSSTVFTGIHPTSARLKCYFKPT